MLLKTETDNFPIEELEVSIDMIIANPWNPNVQPISIYEKLKKVLTQVGFVQPILVRKMMTLFVGDNTSTFTGNYQIIDGFHRWKACKELGWKNIKIWCLIDEITDETAKMLTLIMNNTRGEDEIMKRAKLLTEIDSGQLQLLPFDDKEISFEKDLLKFDFSKFEHTKIDEKEKDPLLKVKYFLHQAFVIFDEVYSKSNNHELRMLIENFNQLYKMFIQMIS